eukprot:scaffold15890_cov80-Skeletonema_menzelii.AAC.1
MPSTPYSPHGPLKVWIGSFLRDIIPTVMAPLRKKDTFVLCPTLVLPEEFVSRLRLVSDL